MTDEKEKLLAAAISQIEKDHGKGWAAGMFWCLSV
jgi:hypothetical protein